MHHPTTLYLSFSVLAQTAHALRQTPNSYNSRAVPQLYRNYNHSAAPSEGSPRGKAIQTEAGFRRVVLQVP
eukprot:3659815-Rhodomonas_salina.2